MKHIVKFKELENSKKLIATNTKKTIFTKKEAGTCFER
jgi:hypothetical protein